MQAIWNGTVVADAPKEVLIYIEGRWYFPPERVRRDLLRESNTPYTCPWKGECQYYDVGSGEEWSRDSAFCYPEPKPSAIDTVHKDFSGYIAFWQDVSVEESDPTKQTASV
jgi:uncharacterized protein (DUF427 family)